MVKKNLNQNVNYTQALKDSIESYFVFNKNDESELGTVFTYFILETILLAKLMKVNAFDQPAVESIKAETQKILRS